MKNNKFIEFVGEHLNVLKGKFATQIRKLGYDFDEDIFSDTIVKCNEKFFDDEALENEMENYFWASFKNNTMRELNYYWSRNKVSDENITDEVMGSTEDDNIKEDVYEEYIIVSNMIIKEFGIQLYKLFSLHANGTEYDELIRESNIKDLKYQFRKIREYVRKNYKRK